MRDINRIKPTIEKLEKLWLANPDIRLGQLIMNVVCPEETNPKLFYIEDDEFLKNLEEIENQMYKKS